MTLEQISALTIASKTIEYGDISNILGKRLLGTIEDVCITVDTALPDYDRILMNEGYPKPTLEMFEQELIEYKAELVEIENNRLEAEALAEAEAEALRLAEVERLEKISIIESRIDKAMNEISDHKKMAEFLGVHIPNPAWKINKELRPSVIINREDPDSTDLSLIEAIEINYDAWEAEEISKEAEQSLALKTKSVISRCDAAIEHIVSKNTKLLLESAMTEDDLDVLEERFADVMSALNMKRPMKAYRILQTLDISGTVYTEEDVQGLSNILIGE